MSFVGTRPEAVKYVEKYKPEGHMKSIGYRLLGFKEELLKFSNSLLGHIKSSMPDAWLRTILR